MIKQPPTQDFRNITKPAEGAQADYGHQAKNTNANRIGTWLFILVFAGSFLSEIKMSTITNFADMFNGVIPKVSKPISQEAPKEFNLKRPTATVDKPDNALSGIKQNFTLDYAYKYNAVPRVPYDSTASPLDQETKDYFAKLFAITDFLVIERVQNDYALRHKKPIGDLYNYELAINEIRKLNTPAEFRGMEEDIVLAIVAEKEMFKQLSDNGQVMTGDNKLAIDNTNRLIDVYNRIIKQYSNETEHNKSAFRQHLCALALI